MLDLNSIKNDVQGVAEAISLAIGCDVEVIDQAGTRIAATGPSGIPWARFFSMAMYIII